MSCDLCHQPTIATGKDRLRQVRRWRKPEESADLRKIEGLKEKIDVHNMDVALLVMDAALHEEGAPVMAKLADDELAAEDDYLDAMLDMTKDVE